MSSEYELITDVLRRPKEFENYTAFAGIATALSREKPRHVCIFDASRRCGHPQLICNILIRRTYSQACKRLGVRRCRVISVTAESRPLARTPSPASLFPIKLFNVWAFFCAKLVGSPCPGALRMRSLRVLPSSGFCAARGVNEYFLTHVVFVQQTRQRRCARSTRSDRQRQWLCE
jgi:hypothetical protein